MRNLKGVEKHTYHQAVQKLVPYLIRDDQMQGAQDMSREAYIDVR